MRPFSLCDLPRLHSSLLRSRAHLERFMWPWAQLAQDSAHVEHWLGAAVGAFAAGQAFYLALLSPDGARLWGSAAFHPQAEGAAEIELWIDVTQAGCGRGQHTLRHLIRWGFRDWGWDTLRWRCEVDNVPSARLAARCGMLYQGLLSRDQPGPDGEARDCLSFAITRARWRQSADAFGHGEAVHPPHSPRPAPSDAVGEGVLCSAPCPSPTLLHKTQDKQELCMIVLDPGHGGTQVRGKSTPSGARSARGHLEKDITLQVCQRLASALGGDVALTRAGDQNLRLGERTAAARERSAHAFLSVHAGGEQPGVWVHTDASDTSLDLASALARGLRLQVQRGELAVLSPHHHAPRTAACLIDLGDFDALTEDERLLQGVIGVLARGLAAPAHASRVRVTELQAPISYAYNYTPTSPGDRPERSDLRNFFLPNGQPAHTPHEAIRRASPARGPGVTGAHWLVLVNVHGPQELNLSSDYDPNKRTLQWGTPYDNAVHTITKGRSAHDASALLRDWSNNAVRKFVTFVCVPPHSELQFWSGYALPQHGGPTDHDSRPGGGVQWRLKGLPKGTITLTTHLFPSTGDDDPNKRRTKEDKDVHLRERLQECLTAYNNDPSHRVKLPSGLATPRALTTHTDDLEIAKVYMDMSLTEFAPYV